MAEKKNVDVHPIIYRLTQETVLSPTTIKSATQLTQPSKSNNSSGNGNHGNNPKWLTVLLSNLPNYLTIAQLFIHYNLWHFIWFPVHDSAFVYCNNQMKYQSATVWWHFIQKENINKAHLENQCGFFSPLFSLSLSLDFGWSILFVMRSFDADELYVFAMANQR